MSGIFGGGVSGASRESQAEQRRANLATEAFIREQTGRAREDALRLFPQGQAFREAGFRGALDLIGAGTPEILSAFQQGNIGAQDIISGALPEIQSAILGTPVDISRIAPREIAVDPAFLSDVQIPTMGALTEAEALATESITPSPRLPFNPNDPRFGFGGGDGRSFRSILGEIGQTSSPTGGVFGGRSERELALTDGALGGITERELAVLQSMARR